MEDKLFQLHAPAWRELGWVLLVGDEGWLWAGLCQHWGDIVQGQCLEILFEVLQGIIGFPLESGGPYQAFPGPGKGS